MDSVEEAAEAQGIPVTEIGGAVDRRWLVVTAVPALAAWILVVVALVAGWSAVVLVVAVFAALAMTGTCLGLLRSLSAWDNPQLFLPSNEPLRLGDQVVVRFRRRARSGVDLAGAVVAARLLVEERCLDPERRAEQRHRIHTQEVPVVMDDTVGNVIEADLSLAIPLYEAPPSLDLRLHDIVWWLEVDIEAPGAPDDTSSFPMVVAPAVSRRLVEGGR